MSNLHPVFQQVIAQFAPLLNKNGSLASHAMTAAFNTTYPLKKPRKSTDTFHYCLAGVDLVCELDYEKASGDGWNEPRDPEAAYLCEAFCGDVDISEILSDKQREEIETAYLDQDRSDA